VAIRHTGVKDAAIMPGRGQGGCNRGGTDALGRAEIMDENGIHRAVTRIAHEILEKNRGVEDLVLIGIQRRGVPLAKMIAAKIAQSERVEPPVGVLDITF